MLAVLDIFWPRPASGPGGDRFFGPVSPPVHLSGGRGDPNLTILMPKIGICRLLKSRSPLKEDRGQCFEVWQFWAFLAPHGLGTRGKRFLGPVSPPVHLSGGRGTQIGPFYSARQANFSHFAVTRPNCHPEFRTHFATRVRVSPVISQAISHFAVPFLRAISPLVSHFAAGPLRPCFCHFFSFRRLRVQLGRPL